MGPTSLLLERAVADEGWKLACLDRIEEALADLRALATIQPDLPAALKLQRELRRARGGARD